VYSAQEGEDHGHVPQRLLSPGALGIACHIGERPSEEAEGHSITLEVVKHEEAKRGFVLLPRRWVVERDFAWASRFRRLVKDYERLPETLAGLHFVAFACLYLQQAVGILSASS
jgi:Transposase DDE domain